MSKNEFDDLLFKKLGEEEFPYEPANWERLSQLLPPVALPATRAKSRKLIWPLGIAAGLALLLTGGLLVKLHERATTTDPHHISITINAPASPTAPAPPSKIDAGEKTPAVKPGSNPTGTSSITGLARGGLTGFTPHPQTLHPTPVAGSAVQLLSVSIAPQGTRLAPNDIPAGTASPTVAEESIASGFADFRPFEPLPEHFSGSDPETAHRQSAATNPGNTRIAVGGGVNYGSLNTGYSVGVTAHQALGSGFFVDGSVAMLYNNNAQNITHMPMPSSPGNGFAARPSTIKSAIIAADQKPLNLYYIQFNPSFGYQIEDNISISVGGDLQQLLPDGENIDKVQFSPEDIKLLPTMDIGLTGKTEIRITPSIEAALLYREGLNNMLHSGSTQYVNRRYFQVQFKYNIPVSDK